MIRSPRWWLPITLAAAASASAAIGACTGHIGEPDPLGQAESEVCSVGVHPGGAPIRRMTRFEYNNAVRDLLGDTTRPADSFVAEEEALGFNNQATALGVTQLLAEQYMEASEAIAGRAAKDWSKLLPAIPRRQGRTPALLSSSWPLARRPFAGPSPRPSRRGSNRSTPGARSNMISRRASASWSRRCCNRRAFSTASRWGCPTC